MINDKKRGKCPYYDTCELRQFDICNGDLDFISHCIEYMYKIAC